MMNPLLFALFGYLCGSVLFANVFAKLFGKDDIITRSKDQNPGTANAYAFGGFWCGTCTLIGDLLKGIVPVYLCFHGMPVDKLNWTYALVIASPVLGHAFPVFGRFKGGKGIAVTFGCLLGLFPYTMPAFLLAFVFIFFSVLLRVTPHFYRTIFTYITALCLLNILRAAWIVRLGFLFISAIVCLRMHLSKEERGKVEVRLSWMR